MELWVLEPLRDQKKRLKPIKGTAGFSFRKANVLKIDTNATKGVASEVYKSQFYPVQIWITPFAPANGSKHL